MVFLYSYVHLLVQELGFGEPHLEDALVEFVRYLLVCGANIAYGGDLRKEGYTEIMFDLVKMNRQHDQEHPGIIHNYLSWPYYKKLTVFDKARWKGLVAFHPVLPPKDLGITEETKSDRETTEGRYCLARSSTKMRKIMNADIDARIVMGGKSQHYLRSASQMRRT